jgi:ribosomal protein L12E/L44/L45/RPP1/RPP2
MGIYGYARISTSDQNLSLQIHALETAGVHEVITEVATGKSMGKAAAQSTRMRESCDCKGSRKNENFHKPKDEKEANKWLFLFLIRYSQMPHSSQKYTRIK